MVRSWNGDFMSGHFADRLIAAVDARGTWSCVGLDPVYAQLPEVLRRRFPPERAVEGLREFCRAVLDVVQPSVAVVKLNIAFFEPFRGAGVELYHELVGYARSLGLIVIGDVKRGDIGHTSMAYARALLADSDAGPGPDVVTLNGYFGVDGVQPFLEVCREQGKGVFVLVHTSNDSAGEVQHAELADGTDVAGRMARLVNEWAHGAGMMGRCGVSAVGAVVAPGDLERARVLRGLMPDSVFLVPGFGAQGRSMAQVAACFRGDGGGALVNSSRGVINAYTDSQYAAAGNWTDAVERACCDLVKSVRAMQLSEPRP